VQEEAERFLDLIFGRPDLSPRLHEHAMYLAYVAALRSADLSRQVGAALTNQHGDILFDITEYGRAVHAEMDAILSCARTGASTRGARLYSTTFPCHNCAKHLVDAGVVEVQYVEAYPKSMASPLHSDAIYWEEDAAPGSAPGNKVAFRHYVGIGPRRYLDLFSLTLGSGRRVKRKGAAGKISLWDRATAEPRVPSDVASRDLERLAIEALETALRRSS
jgi:deoxycytidylate deaminase